MSEDPFLSELAKRVREIEKEREAFEQAPDDPSSQPLSELEQQEIVNRIVRKKPKPRWLAPVIGGAIAATVVAVMVLGPDRVETELPAYSMEVVSGHYTGNRGPEESDELTVTDGVLLDLVLRPEIQIHSTVAVRLFVVDSKGSRELSVKPLVDGSGTIRLQLAVGSDLLLHERGVLRFVLGPSDAIDEWPSNGSRAQVVERSVRRVAP
jgi:hypothetical protein